MQTAGRFAPSRPKRTRGRGRREHDEVAAGQLGGRQLARAVERHEVGVELVDEQPTRALGAGEEDAAGRSAAAPPGAPPGSTLVGNEVGAAERLGRGEADRGDPRGAAPHAPAQSSRAPFALVTTTQS